MINYLPKPNSVQIAITYRCNLKCLHCDIWKKKEVKELNTEEWIKVFSYLRNWIWPFRLDISGGEPFLRKDLIDIIEFTAKREIMTVVTTNATLLNSEVIKKLSNIEALTLNISLDGMSPTTHDYLRNTTGIYDKIIDALLEFKKNRKLCHITIATILMGYNIEEVLSLIKRVIVDNLANAINFQALDYNFHAQYRPTWFKESEFWPSENKKEMFLDMLDKIIKIKKAGARIHNSIGQLIAIREYFNNPLDNKHIKCQAGVSNLIIDPEGNILLCWNMPPIGNVLYNKLEEVWNSPISNERRMLISKCMRTCKILNCNFIEENLCHTQSL